MKERNIFLKIEYDGTDFAGWQRQPGRRTVQGELERALSEVCATEIKINGTSRTDAGVHALGQCASFSGDFGIPADRIPVAVNNILSGGKGSVCGDIRVLAAEEKDPDFHARFDAKGKKYIYKIRASKTPDIFSRDHCWEIRDKLNVEEMKKAASFIEGTHDFRCFQSAGGEERKTTIRTVYSIIIKEDYSCGESVQNVDIEIKGDGFLYNMVRIITGTLVETGLGKRSAADMEKVISGGDRKNAGCTAPPSGLYLAEVYYKVV